MTTPETPGVPAQDVLAGYQRALAEWTQRAITAEAMVGHLIAQSETTEET